MDQARPGVDASNYIFGFCVETQRAWRAFLKPRRSALHRDYATKFEPDPNKPDDPGAFMVASWPDGMAKEITDVTVRDMTARAELVAAVAEQKQEKTGMQACLWQGVLKIEVAGKEAEMPMRISKAKTAGGLALVLYLKQGTNDSVEWNQKQLLQCLVKLLPGRDETEKTAAALTLMKEIVDMLLSREIVWDGDMGKLRDERLKALGAKPGAQKGHGKGKAKAKAKCAAKAKKAQTKSNAAKKRKVEDEEEKDEEEDEKAGEGEDAEEEKEPPMVCTPVGKKGSSRPTRSAEKKFRIFEDLDPDGDKHAATSHKPHISAELLSEVQDLFAS